MFGAFQLQVFGLDLELVPVFESVALPGMSFPQQHQQQSIPMKRIRNNRIKCFSTKIKWLLIVLLHLMMRSVCVTAWEWSDWVSWSTATARSYFQYTGENTTVSLSLEEVSSLRVREIKRRLARNHGYSAEELAKMLDKKELIFALAFEEEKIRIDHEEAMKRLIVKRGFLTAIITIAVVMAWPLFQHAYEVAAVNFVVYTDRKRLEARRCWELRSMSGFVGIIIMFIIDLLQTWLTVSILLSWVMRSKYFFPVPSLPIRPGQILGGEASQSSSISNYGINVAPMVISWLMRFMYNTIERWTGRTLSHAYQQCQRRNSHGAGDDKKSNKREKKKLAPIASQSKPLSHSLNGRPFAGGITDLRNNGISFVSETTTPPSERNPVLPFRENELTPTAGPVSQSHLKFLDELDRHGSVFDELD